MRSLLVGTSGHVDHGKSALVRALTGTDPDRLEEEKRRGITIDLGFAALRRGDVLVGFVDVPGHERFLHNALAGLGGIRVLLLVVAADEGVKPQTREHLAVATLLGIERAVVALAKVDLVAPERIDAVERDVRELLAPTPFAASPIFRVSSATGEGVAALEERLLALARELEPTSAATRRATRLPIDRAFTLRGHGLVATGTLVGGTVAPGDELLLQPRGVRVRIRGVEVHGEKRERAEAGERTALQLAGVEAGSIERGDELVAADGPRPTSRFLARFRLLGDAPAAIEGPTEIRLHLYAAERMARLKPIEPKSLRPGESGLVEISLSSPLVAARGDRWIGRRPSPAATIGGGEVLDPWFAPRRRVDAAALVVPFGGETSAAIRAWLAERAEAGLGEEELAARLGETRASARERLSALVRDGLALGSTEAPTIAFDPAALVRLADRARHLLTRFFAESPLALGMPRAEFVERWLGGRAAGAADEHLVRVAAVGIVVLEGDRVTLPGRRAEPEGEAGALAKTILATYEKSGIEAPSPDAVAHDLAAKREIVEGLVRHLIARGKLVRLPSGLILAATVFDTLAADLRATGWARFSVPQFKTRFGLTRKWAIPLLEQLDSRGITRRVGDERLILPPPRREPSPAER